MTAQAEVIEWLVKVMAAIGENVGQMKTDGPFAGPEPAVKEFLKYFKSKSKELLIIDDH